MNSKNGRCSDKITIRSFLGEKCYEWGDFVQQSKSITVVFCLLEDIQFQNLTAQNSQRQAPTNLWPGVTSKEETQFSIFLELYFHFLMLEETIDWNSHALPEGV